MIWLAWTRAPVPIFDMSVFDDMFSIPLPLISSPCVVSIYCSKCNPPKRLKYEPERNFSGHLQWICFVRPKTGWSHTSTGVWPEFKQTIDCLIISMQWYWVDSVWTGFRMREEQHLFRLIKHLRHCPNDIWTRILIGYVINICYFLQPRLIFQFFRSYELPIIMVQWNIYHNTWSVQWCFTNTKRFDCFIAFWNFQHFFIGFFVCSLSNWVRSANCYRFLSFLPKEIAWKSVKMFNCCWWGSAKVFVIFSNYCKYWFPWWVRRKKPGEFVI